MLLRLIVFVVLAVVATRLCKLAYILGYHKAIYNQYPGPCRVVPNVDKGSEDITVTSDGLAFISSGVTSPRYIHNPRHSPQLVKGRIFLFDFNNPDENATEISLVGNFGRDSFYPHGISLYEDPKTGTVYFC
ncbi:serum paraoxonase/lactonase 3-like [Saccoglossus kowalevskii]|uniref:Serum paraoxonase/lactonase 3-like n=1 Tax=Saccoglossus kowalevskii TaxID=10224 RepID=A0ABM0LZ37_SACKO|nr:PREDICTED: serum paraoxonase/lactonase 3-like [Saccoglossus kowalevskii]